jgi:hypothetical protein
VAGDAHGRHAELRNPPAQLRQAVGSVEERVLAVEMEMDEVAGHRTILSLFPVQVASGLREKESVMEAGP